MTTRCSLLLILCLALVAPVAAHADKAPRPKGPKILITLTDGTMNRGKLDSPLTATFAPPKGTTAAKACKGKIAFSAPIGKKTVKKKGKKKKVTVLAKRSAPVKTVLGSCTATGVLSLPETLIGKTVKFTANFKGNSAVKKAVKSKKLVVTKKADPVPPPVPPTLRTGPWTVTQTNAVGTPLQWGFTIGAGNSLTKRVGRYGVITVKCPGNHGDRQLQYFPDEEAAFDDANVIASNPFVATDEWTTSSISGEHATQSMTMSFSDTEHGIGTFQVKGTFMVEIITPIAIATELVPGCVSDPVTVRLDYGAAA